MAIAYFIPDQAKLLAGRRPTREEVNNQRNSSATSQTNASPQSARNVETSSSPPVNRGYGTTINLTVPTYATQPESTGCWDFLTQVFCHALRFYHESSQLQPTVVQISVNFQSQTAEGGVTTTTATAGNSTASGNSSTDSTATANTNTASATAISTTTANNPSAVGCSASEKPPKPKTSGKRKH